MASEVHSPVESSILELLSDRLESWGAIIAALLVYFGEMGEAERQAHLAHSKMAAALASALPVLASERPSTPQNQSPMVDHPTSPTSSPPSPSSRPSQSHAWLGPMQSHSLRLGMDSETYSMYIRETVLATLEKLREEHRRQAEELRERRRLLEARLERTHQGLVTAVREHERGWHQRLRLRLTSHRQEPSQQQEELYEQALAMTDVWISEQRLRSKIALHLTEKRAYCVALMDLYSRTRALEHDMAIRLQGVLQEAMLVKSQQLTAQAELLNDCAAVLRNNQPLAEWHTALRRYRLDWEWQVSVPPADGFTASLLVQIGSVLSSTADMAMGEATACAVRAVPIRKSGFLMRPGTFGRNWTVFFCVLVESSYLHCYAADAARRASSSPVAGQRRKSQSERGDGGHAAAYRVPSSSMNLHGKALAELNTAATRAWLSLPPGEWSEEAPVEGENVTQAQREGREKSEGEMANRLLTPLLSIPLLHPQTTVLPDTGRASEHVFVITIPGSGSFFGRGEKRYVLRSFVEEDMVDWCIAIKELVDGTALISLSQPESANAPANIPTDAPRKDHFDPLPEAEDLMMPFDVDTGGFTIETTLGEGPAMEEETEFGSQNITYHSPAARPVTPTTPLEDLENPWEK